MMTPFEVTYLHRHTIGLLFDLGGPRKMKDCNEEILTYYIENAVILLQHTESHLDI